MASSFSYALNWLKAGKKATRTGWNGKGMWIQMQKPDAYSKMNLPYIYMKTVTNQCIPWVASHSDLLGEDWELVD